MFQDQALVLTEIAHDVRLAFIEVVRDAFEIMVADTLVEAHGALIQRQQPQSSAEGLARNRVGVQYGVQIPARQWIAL